MSGLPRNDPSSDPALSVESAPTVNLAKTEVGSVLEEAQAHSIRSDAWARLGMSIAIVAIFIALNYETMKLVRDILAVDIRFVEARPPAIQPGERIVTTQVLMTLIGATVVQVGAAIFAITTYLFPKSPKSDARNG